MVAAIAPVAGKAIASIARKIFTSPAARKAVLANKAGILKHAGHLQKSVDKLGGAGAMASMVAFPYGAMVAGLAGKGQITNAASIFTKVAGRMST